MPALRSWLVQCPDVAPYVEELRIESFLLAREYGDDEMLHQDDLEALVRQLPNVRDIHIDGVVFRPSSSGASFPAPSAIKPLRRLTIESSESCVSSEDEVPGIFYAFAPFSAIEALHMQDLIIPDALCDTFSSHFSRMPFRLKVRELAIQSVISIPHTDRSQSESFFRLLVKHLLDVPSLCRLWLDFEDVTISTALGRLLEDPLS